MPRPALEVADIFRGHGPAWRQANAGHVSLDQLKVMSAIESCRTAALGGRRLLARRQALGLVPAGLLPPGARAVAIVPSVVPAQARRRSCGRRAAVLRQSCRAEGYASLRRLSGAAAQRRMGGL